VSAPAGCDNGTAEEQIELVLVHHAAGRVKSACELLHAATLARQNALIDAQRRAEHLQHAQVCRHPAANCHLDQVACAWSPPGETPPASLALSLLTRPAAWHAPGTRSPAGMTEKRPSRITCATSASYARSAPIALSARDSVMTPEGAGDRD